MARRFRYITHANNVSFVFSPDGVRLSNRRNEIWTNIGAALPDCDLLVAEVSNWCVALNDFTCNLHFEPFAVVVIGQDRCTNVGANSASEFKVDHPLPGLPFS